MLEHVSLRLHKWCVWVSGEALREGTLHPPLHVCDSCARGQTLYRCLVGEEAGIFTVITLHPSPPTPPYKIHRAARRCAKSFASCIYVRERVSECRGRWVECSSSHEGLPCQPGQDVSHEYFVAVLFPW